MGYYSPDTTWPSGFKLKISDIFIDAIHFSSTLNAYLSQSNIKFSDLLIKDVKFDGTRYYGHMRDIKAD